jgi:hypothetical protein
LILIGESTVSGVTTFDLVIIGEFYESMNTSDGSATSPSGNLTAFSGSGTIVNGTVSGSLTCIGQQMGPADPSVNTGTFTGTQETL